MTQIFIYILIKKGYIRDIVLALEYLHTRNPPIIHRDIKPENLLLDNKQRVKLADFGWSNYFENHERVTYCGTADYLAPEMIDESGHDKSLDIWCLGVLIFELMLGKSPFAPNSQTKDQRERQKLMEKNIKFMNVVFPNDFPMYAKDLCSKLLKKNPKERILISEIKIHPWLIENEEPISPIKKHKKKSVLKIEDIKVDNNSNGFNKSEILEIANKQGSIVNPSEIKRSDKRKPTKTDEITQRTINDLNEKIQSLGSYLNKITIKLKIKENEINNFKSDIENYNGNSSSNLSSNLKGDSNKKYKLIDDEINNFKGEIAQYELMIIEKTEILNKQKMNLSKYENLKKKLDKLKNNKSEMLEKSKDLQNVIKNKEKLIEELLAKKEEKKVDTEIINKSESQKRFSNFDENKLKIEMLVIKNELDGKIQDFKEKIEIFDKKQTKIRNFEKEINRLENNKQNEIEHFQINLNEKFQEEFEEKINDYENKILSLQKEQEDQKIEYQELINNLIKENNHKNLEEIKFKNLNILHKLQIQINKDIESESNLLGKFSDKIAFIIKSNTNIIKDQEETIKTLKEKSLKIL